MNRSLGKRIRSLREDRNLTQEYVAGELEMSRQKYARIENGVNNITLNILASLATVFGVAVADITRVLDEEPLVEYRTGESDNASIDVVYDMLDLFYVNKRVYDRMHYKDME